MMATKNQQEGLDLIYIASKLISKWYIILVSVIICLGLAYVKIKTSPKIYEVYSILKMNVGSTKSEMILNAADFEKKDVNIEDKIIEIKSTNFIKETIDKLDFGISYFTKGDLVNRERYKLDFPITVKIDSSINNLTNIPIYINILNNKEFELQYTIEDLSIVALYNYSEDIIIKRQFPKQRIKRKYLFDSAIIDPDLGLGFTISLIGDPKKYGDDKLFFKINNPNTLTEIYLNKLNLEIASRNSNIMYLRVGSNIIRKETAFLNTLMDVIIQKNLDDKNLEALKTIDFIDYQLADVSSSLNKVESDLETIGYATTSIGESSVLYEQRNQLETQIAEYNVQLSNLRNYLNNLESIEGSASSSGALDIDDPMINNLLIKLTELYQQRATLKRTATEANPVIQRINLEVETTKQALRNALNGAINNLNAVQENLKYRLRQVNATINKLPSAERRKLGIQRKFEFSDNTYDLFMQRKATAGIALATNESDWSIIEYARDDGVLISPKIKFIYLLAIFLGFLFPSVFIIALDTFDDRIKDIEELKRATSIPVLGSIPKGNKNKKLAIHYNSKSALLESLRDLRINLQYLSNNQNNKILGFTSSTSNEGKTFCAVNLAIVLAQSGRKVIILDADLRNSSILEPFDLKNIRHGLSSYLIGNCSIPEIINSTGIKNLELISAGAFPPNPSDLLSLPKTEILLKQLRDNYDFIVIDTPPIGLVGDYLNLSKYIDVSLYIIRYRYTHKKSLDKINALHKDKKLQNLIMVFNEVKVEELYGSNPYYIHDKKKLILREH